MEVKAKRWRISADGDHVGTIVTSAQYDVNSAFDQVMAQEYILVYRDDDQQAQSRFYPARASYLQVILDTLIGGDGQEVVVHGD